MPCRGFVSSIPSSKNCDRSLTICAKSLCTSIVGLGYVKAAAVLRSLPGALPIPRSIRPG